MIIISLVIISTLIITIVLTITGTYGLEASFRNAIFTVLSIMGTSGFVTSDYMMWPGGFMVYYFYANVCRWQHRFYRRWDKGCKAYAFT